jgi:hypothetical protein
MLPIPRGRVTLYLEGLTLREGDQYMDEPVRLGERWNDLTAHQHRLLREHFGIVL